MKTPAGSGSVDTDWGSFRSEIESELGNILRYWEQFTPDYQEGGFIGRIDADNKPDWNAPKGSVLNSRILWTFSAAYSYTGNPRHLDLATRAYRYIKDFLRDKSFGGLYWSVDHQGRKLDSHKQVYAQAFGIYGMSEYFRASRDPQALELALEWYHLLEKYSRDQHQGGYIDAFAENWGFLQDKRLSAKDENASKTMNTHLHIVEAYANLYTVWPSHNLKTDIVHLLEIFDQKMIDPNSHHLCLFFTDNWQKDPAIISYGHDIEAGWLLQACAESIGDTPSIQAATGNALRISEAVLDGFDQDGGLWYEYNQTTKELVREKHWWPQAEALVGLCNAWQLSGNMVFKNAMVKNWQFIRNYILDEQGGEWVWGIDSKSNPMEGQDKVGIWKCPYHNSRACLELLKRIN